MEEEVDELKKATKTAHTSKKKLEEELEEADTETGSLFQQ